MKVRPILYCLVIAVGFLQTLGYLFHSKELRGIGMASASSPLPLVFTDVRGVETFASRFILQYTIDTLKYVELTNKLYSRLPGPYNRRNVYGAAFAYGPLLPEQVRNQILQHALCKAQILKEMNIETSSISNAHLLIKTKTKGRSDVWTYDINCE